jgi:hypothetical protein
MLSDTADDRIILQELTNLELLLMKSTSPSDISIPEKLLSENFLEFGASGKSYNKQETLSALRKRASNHAADNWIPYNFTCMAITDSAYLLTYCVQRNDGLSMRSSIWKKSNNQWQILFHQGTIVKE